MTRLGPRPALPFEYATGGAARHVTYQLAHRLIRLCYQVARGNVSQQTVEEARRLEFVLRDRKQAEVRAGRQARVVPWRERGTG